jgi:hypothetical protein
MSMDVVATFPTDMMSKTYMQVDTGCMPMYNKAPWYWRSPDKMIIMDYGQVFNQLFKSMKENKYSKPSEANWKCDDNYMLPIIGFMKDSRGVGLVPKYSIDSKLKTITFYNEYKIQYSKFLDDVNAVLSGKNPNHAIEPPQFAFSGGTRRSRKRRSTRRRV